MLSCYEFHVDFKFKQRQFQLLVTPEELFLEIKIITIRTRLQELQLPLGNDKIPPYPIPWVRL